MKIGFFLIALSTVIVGCQSASTPEPVSTSPTPPPAMTAAVASFASAHAVFKKNCIQCHTGPSAKDGYDYSSYATMKNNLAITPGDPEHSYVIMAMKGQGKKQMPPTGKIADADIQIVADWIKAGAKEN